MHVFYMHLRDKCFLEKKVFSFGLNLYFNLFYSNTDMGTRNKVNSYIARNTQRLYIIPLILH